MRQYFFDIQDGDQFIKDNEGSLLNGNEEARTEAITALAEIVKDDLLNGEKKGFAVIVRDETGQLIYQARLSFHGEWM